MKKKLFVVFVFFYISTTFAQSNLDTYKYVIIPKKYDFLKEEDKFELNSLTEFLFKKAGFQTLIKGEDYPEDLVNNPCLAVLADLKDNSSMFTTKLTIDLTDCHNKVVYTAAEGKSKEKEYKKTYQEALRKSFTSFESLNYNYNPALVVNSNKKQVIETPPPVIVNKVEPKAEDIKTATVVAAPVVISEVKEDTDKKPVAKVESIANSYYNENISFFLIEQNNDFVAYVTESKIDSYKKGEMIGKFVKTSLPNVYKVSWKNKQEGVDETIAYFDENGNLKIEINRNGKIEVRLFKAEK